MKINIGEDVANATKLALAATDSWQVDWFDDALDYSDSRPAPGGVTQSIHREVRIELTGAQGITLLNQLRNLIRRYGGETRAGTRTLNLILKEWERVISTGQAPRRCPKHAPKIKDSDKQPCRE